MRNYIDFYVQTANFAETFANQVLYCISVGKDADDANAGLLLTVDAAMQQAPGSNFTSVEFTDPQIGYLLLNEETVLAFAAQNIGSALLPPFSQPPFLLMDATPRSPSVTEVTLSEWITFDSPRPTWSNGK